MGRQRVEREGLGRAMRERERVRVGGEGGEGIMEKNQAKRIHAGVEIDKM